jgi:hypothetical protein
MTDSEWVLCVCGETHEAMYMGGIRIVPCPYAPKERIYMFSEPPRLESMAVLVLGDEESDE